MKKTLASRLVVAAFLLGVTWSPGWADGVPGDPGAKESRPSQSRDPLGHRGGPGDDLIDLLIHAKEVGLSEGQLANLKAVLLDLDLTRITAEADIMLMEREIAGMVADDAIDISAIEAKIKQSEALEAALRVAAVKATRAATALLTPAQREKSRLMHEQSGHGRDRTSAHPPPKKAG